MPIYRRSRNPGGSYPFIVSLLGGDRPGPVRWAASCCQEDDRLRGALRRLSHPNVVLLLLLLPLLVHLPALTGWLRFDPIYVVSGLTQGSWSGNGLLDGYPGWIDANAGVTTEALGRLAALDWLHGVVPWWDPYAGVGLPLAAEAQNSAFFLPFVLLLALPHGLLALRIVLMALAGLFTRALLVRLGCTAMPALVGAALFELNGTFAWMAHGPIMPVAFLPLLLLGIEQARGGGLPPVAIVLGMAWSLLAGFPETAFIDGLFAGCWFMLRMWQSAGRVRYAARVAAGVVIGIMLAAPGIWPFVEALPRCFIGLHGNSTRVSLLPGNFALLLFPYVYGTLAMGLSRIGRDSFVWWCTGGYCDLVLVATAMLGAVRLRVPERGMRWLLLGWLLATLARTAGLPGAVALFDAVPLLRQAAFGNYVLPSWSMALAVLAALALQDRGGPAHRRPGLALATLVPLAGYALWLGRREIALRWRALPHYAVFPVASVLVAAAMLGLLAWLWPRQPVGRTGRRIGFVLILHACALAALPLLSGTRGRRVDIASVRFLQSHLGLGRVVAFGPLVPNYGSMFQIAEIGSNYLPDPLAWVDYVRRNLKPDMDGVNFSDGILPGPGARLVTLMQAFRLAGVRYALTWPGEGPVPGAVLAWRGAAMDVWDLADPAAYFQAAGCTVTPASRLRVVVRCSRAATLTRLELAWPGWRARVNAMPTPIATSGIFQAVNVPVGRSDVVFRYAPPGIDFAWLACGLAAAMAGLRATWTQSSQTRRLQGPVAAAAGRDLVVQRGREIDL